MTDIHPIIANPYTVILSSAGTGQEVSIQLTENDEWVRCLVTRAEGYSPGITNPRFEIEIIPRLGEDIPVGERNRILCADDIKGASEG